MQSSGLNPFRPLLFTHCVNNNGHKQPIKHFNWDNNIAIDSSDDDCIYIDREKGNKWFTESCNSPSLKYVICMNGEL